VIVGHRGGRGDGWPRENTLAAFEQARQQGALAIELDVRMCAEGDAVVFHDRTMSRTADARDARPLDRVPLAELRSLGVPTLEEALSWARSRAMAVNVEMKHDVVDITKLVGRTLRGVREVGGDVLISSFDPRVLFLTALSAPSLPRALLVRRRQPLWARALQRAARPPLFHWLHLERTQVHASALTRHLRRGLRVGVWTVNDPLEAVELVRLGVASIITDAPGAISKALAFTGN
jgi:glycerophosphoryl diester phosphodiesterase